MPKRKNRKGNADEGSDDDMRSDVSTDGLELAEEERVENLETSFAAACDSLTEKRASAREKGILALTGLLQKSYVADLLEGKAETVSHDIINCARRGGNGEACTALRALRALLVTLGPTASTPLFKDLSETLTTLVTSHKNASVRREAAESLALLVFVASEEPSDTEAVGATLFEYIKPKTDSDVLLGCLDGYSLVLTTIPAAKVVSGYFKTAMAAMMKLLEHEDLDIRISAGENIALLFEAMLEHKEDYVHDFSTLDETLKALATDSSKRKSKKERSKQRSIFRDILKYIEDGESPEESLKMKNEKVTFESWTELRHLDAFRDAVGAGFHIHFKKNSFVRDVLQLGPAPEDKHATRGDRRVLREQHSWMKKMRQKQRGKQREAAEVGREGEESCYADGE